MLDFDSQRYHSCGLAHLHVVVIMHGDLLNDGTDAPAADRALSAAASVMMSTFLEFVMSGLRVEAIYSVGVV